MNRPFVRVLAALSVALLLAIPSLDAAHVREGPYDSHSYTISISPDYTNSDGMLVAAGNDVFRSFDKVNRNGGGTGVVLQYELDGSFVKEIQNPDAEDSYDYFGQFLQIQDGYLIIGVPSDAGDLGGDAVVGKIWLYDIAAGEFVREIFSPEPTDRSWFGGRFVANDDTLVVGDDECGCLRVYDFPSGDYRGRIDSDLPPSTISPIAPRQFAFRGDDLFVAQAAITPTDRLGFFWDTHSFTIVDTLQHASLDGLGPADIHFAGGHLYFTSGPDVVVADSAGVIQQRIVNPDEGWFNNLRPGLIHHDRLILPARAMEVNGVDFAGRVYVYDFQGGAWQLEARLENPVPREYTGFGYHVAVAGEHLVVMTRGSGAESPSRFSTHLLDTDDDGLSDQQEGVHGTDARNPDTDGDGLNDGDEIAHGVDPLVQDSDGDGLLDGEEVHVYGTWPGRSDSDLDGLSDPDELFVHGTDPIDRDTDGDLASDGHELNRGTDPTNPFSFPTQVGNVDPGLPTQGMELPVTDDRQPTR